MSAIVLTKFTKEGYHSQRSTIGGWLARVQDEDGSWSVQSDPDASWDDLAGAIPQAFVRTTTLNAVRAKGGRLVWSHHGPGDYHCDLFGLTPAAFDAILGPATRNPRQS